MIALSPQSTSPWQAEFLKLLPLIRRHAKFAFRDLKGNDFDDAVQEAIANALVAYARLAQQGRADQASASSLARYAVAHYWAGRRVGAKSNIHDVTSAYCRSQRGVRIESLHHWDKQDQAWREVLVEDKNVTPAELAASRIDVPAWLKSLSPRERQIAELLATGETTSQVANDFGVSRGRISQLRRQLHESWVHFCEPDQEAAA